MKTKLLAASFAALLATSAIAFAQPDGSRGRGEDRARIESLLTQTERDQFREKMRAAQSPEDRAAIQKQRRGLMEQRAKEKGITLPQAREERGHSGHGEGRQGRSERAQQMLTPEERQQVRERMHAAKTPEERAAIRKQTRATMEQRAKEKGITLPPEKDRSRRDGPQHPQLFSPEERKKHLEALRAAKTPEERATLRTQMHDQAQQRAKEKGITLPERRRGGDAPKGTPPAAKS